MVVGVDNFMKISKIMKNHDFHCFSLVFIDFHDFGDSQWSQRLCTGHQTLANVENVIQTFQNASEMCVSDREKVPRPPGAAYPWWSGQLIS